MNDRKTVLVVDDDLMLLDMAEDALKEDFAVSFALSGEEALSLIAGGFTPDIILLDIDMPGINGFDTLAQLRENQAVRDIPVVFLTGMTAEEHEVRGLSLGAMDYIKKPFVKNILLARLKVYLDTGMRLRERHTLDEERLNRLRSPLTATEMKVARLLAKGYTNEQITKELSYSMDYVKKLVARVLGKLGIEYRGRIVEFLK